MSHPEEIEFVVRDSENGLDGGYSNWHKRIYGRRMGRRIVTKSADD
jgi:hypothetical protein